MAAGLIAGAIQGLGGAMQHNAQGQIKEKREKALMALEQEMAFEQQDRQWGRDDQVWDRETDREDMLIEKKRGFEVEDRDLGYQHDWGLTKYRQGQQNYRTTAGAGKIVRMDDGSYGQYNPIDNSLTALPDGIDPVGLGQDGDLTDRQRARIDMLGDRANALREKQAEGIEPLTAEEKANLGRIEAEMDSLLGGRSGPTPLEQLMAGEEGAGQADGQDGPDQGSIPGIIERERATQQNTQEANAARRTAVQARDQADAVLDKIEQDRAGGATPGGLMDGVNRARGQGGSVSDETLAEAQQVAEELLALDGNANLSADQKRWLAERLMRLQDAGVPINLEQ